MGSIRRYLPSLPERVVRAGAALAGGAIYETSELLLPRVLRRTKLYEATVARLLRILVELVGGVDGVYPAGAMPVGELTKRKAAGNVVEFASIAAVGWSPLWLLAAASDVTGGSKAYLRALATELTEAGLLAPDADVASFEGLLTRLETTTGTLADTVDVPPLNLADARAAWTTLRGQAAALPRPDDLAAIYEGLQAAARREGQPLAELSATVGLAAARAGLELGNVHVFDYYRQALRDIAEEGLLGFLRRVTTPYLRRAAAHFHPATPTQTDRFLRWVSQRDRGPGRGDQSQPSGPV